MSCTRSLVQFLGSAFLLVVATPAFSATVSWGEVFSITSAADIQNPVGYDLVEAIDFNTDAAPSDDSTINGIAFTRVTASPFNSGPSYDATFWPTATDDVDLDSLLDSHVWQGANPGTATLTLGNLTVGTQYSLQLINVADTRGCCATRTYEPDDGLGNFTTGLQLTRGSGHSVVGQFTADAESQTVLFRSLDNAGGNNDPGLTGYVLMAQQIPEPSSVVLAMLGLAVGVLATYRGRQGRRA